MDEKDWLKDLLKKGGLTTTLLGFAFLIIKTLLDGVIQQNGALVACLIFLPMALCILCLITFAHIRSTFQGEIRRKARSKEDLEKKVLRQRKSTAPIDDGSEGINVAPKALPKPRAKASDRVEDADEDKIDESDQIGDDTRATNRKPPRQKTRPKGRSKTGEGGQIMND